MVSPASRAVCFTGEKEISLPRPLGRSGWVITARISMSFCARRLFKEGTANWGVPQKTRRMLTVQGANVWGPRRTESEASLKSGAYKTLPLALLAHFFYFAAD